MKIVTKSNDRVLFETYRSTLQDIDLNHTDLRFADLRSVNLQKANLYSTDLQEADLEAANLWRADLRHANLRKVNLEYAILQFANLQDTNLHEADFWYADLGFADLKYANLQKADLRFADLQDADLRNAKLQETVFSQAKLKGALLPHYDETPVIPNIHKAVYEAASTNKALNMGDWHTCETTHCWAGWVVTLAGEAGRALEAKIGTDAAAALIYAKSDPNLEQIPDWYACDEEALEDMRRLAA